MNFVQRRTAGIAVAFVVLLVGCAPAAQNGATVSATAPGVVPAPSSMEPSVAAAPFRLDEGLQVTGDADATAALTALVRARTSGEVDPSTGSGTGGGRSGTAHTIDLRIEGGAAESYRIAVDEASVVVTGADTAGLFYGVQTLAQLISRDADGFAIRAVQIADAPRFAYRGVMLDVARHFHSVETVKAYIDRAAGLKFNALHLHLTDDQGWRIHLDSRPKLTELASGTAAGGGPGGFYSTADYREIVDYAASRHMIVVPEVDLPGHTHAVGLAYPELAEAPVLSQQILDAVDQSGEAPAAGVPTPESLSASRR